MDRLLNYQEQNRLKTSLRKFISTQCNESVLSSVDVCDFFINEIAHIKHTIEQSNILEEITRKRIKNKYMAYLNKNLKDSLDTELFIV